MPSLIQPCQPKVKGQLTLLQRLLSILSFLITVMLALLCISDMPTWTLEPKSTSSLHSPQLLCLRCWLHVLPQQVWLTKSLCPALQPRSSKPVEHAMTGNADLLLYRCLLKCTTCSQQSGRHYQSCWTAMSCRCTSCGCLPAGLGHVSPYTSMNNMLGFTRRARAAVVLLQTLHKFDTGA